MYFNSHLKHWDSFWEFHCKNDYPKEQFKRYSCSEPVTKTLERDLLKSLVLVVGCLVDFFVVIKVKYLRNIQAMHSQLFLKCFPWGNMYVRFKAFIVAETYNSRIQEYKLENHLISLKIPSTLFRAWFNFQCDNQNLKLFWK